MEAVILSACSPILRHPGHSICAQERSSCHRASFLSGRPGPSHGACAYKGSTVCCHCLNAQDFFNKAPLHFHFALARTPTPHCWICSPGRRGRGLACSPPPLPHGALCALSHLGILSLGP